MQGYLDIHSHVLPKVDDGSKNLAMSMEMIRMAYEQGVRVMIATPHYYCGHKNASTERVNRAYQELCNEIKKEYTDFILLLGNEIYYTESTIQEVAAGNANCLAKTRYVLIEFPLYVDYRKIYAAVQELARHGYFPILAHIDRYPNLLGKEKEINALIEAGAYIQINTEAFVGNCFQRRYRFVWKLLKTEKIHFLGSDCHDDKVRIPLMENVIKIFRKKVNKDILEKLLVENPINFLNGQYISVQ